MKSALALLLTTTLGCGPLTAVIKNAPARVAECFRDARLERSVAAALSAENSEARLDTLSEQSTIEKVACAVWAIVQSLGAATQDAAPGELGVSQPAFGVARKPDDQPKLDTALKWLKRHGQHKEPAWPHPKIAP